MMRIAANIGLFLVASGAFADPEQNYGKHCASCHDRPLETKSPGRPALEKMSASRLRHALQSGKMQIYAEDMSREELRDLVSYLSAAGEEATVSTCVERNVSTTAVIGYWGLAGRNTRYQPNSTVSSETVGSLKLKWAFGFGGVTDMRSYPAATEDTLFVATVAGTLYAIDRESGCVKWRYRNDTPFRTAVTIANHDGRTLLLVGDIGAQIHAVDALDGKLVWRQSVALFPQSTTTGAPVYHAGRVFAPVSAFEVSLAARPSYECCKSHGGVVSLDADTGAKLWTAHMTADAKPTYENAEGTQMWGPSGAPVWTSATIDAKRGVLYVGTGENTSSPASDRSDSIVALDLDDGSIRWHFQATEGDAFNLACTRRGNRANCPREEGPDFDFGATPILITTASGDDVILAGQKSGSVFALNPDASGKVIWQRRLSNGSALGGVHWGMAVNHQTLFVPISDPERATREPKPGVYALDVATGETRWSHRASRNCELQRGAFQRGAAERPECPHQYGFSAAASTTNDIVFAGALDGRAFAFHANTGKILWEYDTNRPFETVNGVEGHGGAIDNAGIGIAGDQIFVLSGYSMFGQMPGNVLLVFETQ